MHRALLSAVVPVVSATVGFRRTITQTITWRRFRHNVALLASERVNSHFTGFLRLPTQFEALAGPVIASMRESRKGQPVRIAVLGCSNGAEAYSVASTLRNRHPDLDFKVRGYDIDTDCLRTANAACYQADQIFNNRIIPNEFVCSTFDQVDGAFVVKKDIACRVKFDLVDVRRQDLFLRVGPCDIVFAQNVLFHMRRPVAREALHNIAMLLRRGSVLFIDGVDLDLRARFSRQLRLLPLEYQIERIHEEARRARSVGWPYQYWGLEPFLPRPDAVRRYATIFMVP